MQTPVWRAAHVYYYDDDKDGLILDAVRPLLGELTPHVDRAYFVRHWRRGPHLRIPMLATPDAFRSIVEPAVADVIGAHLATHPSRAALPPEDTLLPMHQRLAELERDAGPLRPLAPDNTISWEPHDRRLEVLGGDAGADLLAEFYAGTNDLVFRMIEQARTGRSVEALGLALMLAVAHRFFGDPPSLGHGFISFRSHAEAFLHSSSDPQRIRASFDRQYATNQRALTALVGAVVRTLDEATDEVPFVGEWIEVMRPFWVRSSELVASAGAAVPADWDPAGASPMHRMMGESAAFRSLIFEDPAFQRYRLVLNYTYLHMARLGVMGYARYRLCHLAANAVEDALGVDAAETVRTFIAQNSATPAHAGEWNAS